jgi:hypothetical protein
MKSVQTFIAFVDCVIEINRKLLKDKGVGFLTIVAQPKQYSI